MSDEARRPGEIDEPRRTHAGLFHHDCEHPGCGRWGAFGFARNGNVKDTTWRCYEHRIIE